VTTGPQLSDVWTAGGVLLGLQGAVFTQRLHRQLDVAKDGDRPRLPYADLVNLVSALTTIFGVFVLPILGYPGLAKYAFALAVLLFAGHLFAVAGHYELFIRPGAPSSDHVPRQERIVLGFVGLAAALYVVLAIVHARR
jgi:hypothetical protein